MKLYETVRPRYGKTVVPLVVDGDYVNGRFIGTVSHAGQVLKADAYEPLKADAVRLAIQKHREYVEDQEETKHAAISRLCGTR